MQFLQPALYASLRGRDGRPTVPVADLDLEFETQSRALRAAMWHGRPVTHVRQASLLPGITEPLRVVPRNVGQLDRAPNSNTVE